MGGRYRERAPRAPPRVEAVCTRCAIDLGPANVEDPSERDDLNFAPSTHAPEIECRILKGSHVVSKADTFSSLRLEAPLASDSSWVRRALSTRQVQASSSA